MKSILLKVLSVLLVFNLLGSPVRAHNCAQIFQSLIVPTSTLRITNEEDLLQLKPVVAIAGPQLQKSRYRVNRYLWYYDYVFSFLGVSFRSVIEGLSNQQTWVDLGSGLGLALLDFFRDLSESSSHSIPYGVGIGYEHSPKSNHENLRFLSGRLYEDLPLNEIPKFHIASDYFGVFSYTKYLNYYFASVFFKAEPHAQIFIYIMDSRNQININGKSINLMQWFLENSSGITYDINRRKNVPEEEPNNNDEYGVRILLTGNEVSFPEVSLLSEVDDMPPARTYVPTGRWITIQK